MSVEINLTQEEKKAEKLTDAHLSRAIKALRQDGYVILNDVVAHDHLDVLAERMAADLDLLMKAETVPHNFIWGNVQQDPPPFAPYVFGDVLVNPWVIQVTKALLGEGVYNSYYSGNTNVPNSQLQPVHADSGHLWPGLNHAHPAARVVVNVALDEVTEENGSIELWPGTHLDTHKVVGEDIKIDEARVAARRNEIPPVRGNTKKGSVLIRDIRLWHRGMPNVSNRIRFMIAMIHNCRWYHHQKPLIFGKECEAFFANSGLAFRATYVDGPIDYLYRNKPYDYQKTSQSEMS